MKNEKKSGLVICAKSARTEDEGLKFVSLAQVEEAIQAFPESPSISPTDTSSRYVFSVSPGSMRIQKHDPRLQGERVQNWQARKPVLCWSPKSRSRMVERLATLDYSPFEIENTMIAFLTLTYPGDWLTVVPSADEAKKHFRALQKRFERTFGRPFFAVWKMEFQRRGAPHFHLLAPIPIGVHFSEWLSACWANIVAHPNPTEKAKHLLAGTATDVAKGISANNAQRISYYFSKHASANVGPKEYQNTPPEEWVAAGSVGRFWGYWGVKPAIAKIGIAKENALFVARTLRRWQRANRKIRKKKVWRTDTKTGVVKSRLVNRRQRINQGVQAFRLVPEAHELATRLGRYLVEHGGSASTSNS